MTIDRVRRIALTGGIATGKSHVRARFEALGVPTIDADVLARDAVAPGSRALAEVTARFGAGVLDRSGALDRRKLGALVFANPGERQALEAIVHPEVQRAMEAWFRTLPPSQAFAIADIPLLYEVGRAPDFDAVIVTACGPEVQVQRVMHRDHLTEAEARQRIQTQMPIEEKARQADYVIRTDGSIEETNTQVLAVYRELSAGSS